MKIVKTFLILGLCAGMIALGYYSCQLGWMDTAINFFKGLGK